MNNNLANNTSVKHICEFHIKPRGKFFGHIAYDAQATICDENNEQKLYLFVDRLGDDRQYVVSKCSQMEDDINKTNPTEEEIEEMNESLSLFAFFAENGMPEAAMEALWGPEGPMVQEVYYSVEEMEYSTYNAIFHALDAVIDMMEAFRISDISDTCC